MQTVIIIGGGSTVRGYDVTDLRARGIVIAVNDAAVLARCHMGLTMDRLWMENRYGEYLTRCDGELWARESALRNIPEHPRIFKFECDHESTELSSKGGVLNGTNSGLCALNLAYQMNPERVFLLGFDMCRSPAGEPYWYPPYEWASQQGGTSEARYSTWAKEFETAKRQFDAIGCTVYNVTHRSKIESFPKIKFNTFLEMTPCSRSAD